MKEAATLKSITSAVLQKTTRTASAVERSIKGSIAGAPPELRRAAGWILLGAVGLLALITAGKLISYHREAARRAAEIAAGPRVRTAKVTRGAGEHATVVIGETRPYVSATLYAKVSGYLRMIRVDKGDPVKRGALLATIESPETDEAFVAAKADDRNKQAIWQRMQALFAKQLVSQQEADQAQADAEVAAAKLRSQKTLKDYEILRAPFDGTVTARYADPGALVQNATNSQTSALPVVMVSQINRLRVDVFLDQRDAPFVKAGDPVVITLAERPELKIDGMVSRLSDQLDPRTKMLLTEIDIPNSDAQLVAGSFVQVSLQIKAPSYLEAPVEAMALKGGKTYLTEIRSDNTLVLKPVQVANNDGKSLEIISGVNEGDLLAMDIGDTLAEGSKLRPIVEKAP